MTKLQTITESLQDSIKMITRLLKRIENSEADRVRYKSNGDYYDNAASRSRSSDSRRRYRRYASNAHEKAALALKSKQVMTTEAKAMMKNFKGAMERFELLAKGRDESIRLLKLKVEESRVIYSQAVTAQAVSETNVLITYAKSNFALLNGVIQSIKKSASKDEAMLLGALEAMNNNTIKHTQRMLDVSAQSIDVLLSNAAEAKSRADFKDASVVSSFATITQAKTTVFLDGIEGKSDNIVGTSLVFVAAGILAGKSGSIIKNLLFKEKKNAS